MIFLDYQLFIISKDIIKMLINKELIKFSIILLNIFIFPSLVLLKHQLCINISFFLNLFYYLHH
jgi:hypothetical protein